MKRPGCQAGARVASKKVLVSGIVAILFIITAAQSGWCKSNQQKTDQSDKSAVPVKLAATADQATATADQPTASEKLIVPPQENRFFYVRTDGQPYVLNVDTTVNLTDALDRFYYNPRWRGEVWTPFDQLDEIERQTRLMGTWPEYDQANIFRVSNPIHKWFEKYSGFGP